VDRDIREVGEHRKNDPPPEIKWAEEIGPGRAAQLASWQRKVLPLWGERMSENAGKSRTDREDAARVQGFLESFYSKADFCDALEWDSNTVNFRNRGSGEGLGSLLNGYLISSMQALLRGKRLCSHEAKSVYINKEDCPSQSWDCLFEELSEACPCSQLRTVKSNETFLPPHEAKRCLHGKPDKLHYSERDLSNGASYFVYDKLSSSMDGDFPLRPDHWYMAQLYHYFLRPNKGLKEYKKQLQEKLFPDWNPEKTISVHLRRGDHWMGGHLDDDAYCRTIQMVAETTGADTVFLGTDDLTALKEYPKRLAPLKVISIPANYSIISSLNGGCKGMDKKCKVAQFLTKQQSSDEGKLLMAQIYLMKEALVTIGTIGSNFGRVIHQLQWADKSLKQDYVDPSLHFLEMSGDHYFSCGWRLSVHLEKPNLQATEEWQERYKYIYGSPK